jgi:hypothetical protein
VTAANIKTAIDPRPAIKANCGGTNIIPTVIPIVHISNKMKNSLKTKLINPVL